MSSIVAHWYRAMCFGEACGPWRTSLREVRADLEERKLGSYDEFGQFYITVPGGIDRESDWMDYDVWLKAHLPPISRASERPARLRAQQSCRARRHSVRSCHARGYSSTAPVEPGR